MSALSVDLYLLHVVDLSMIVSLLVSVIVSFVSSLVAVIIVCSLAILLSFFSCVDFLWK